MMIDARLLADIKNPNGGEGCSLTAYKDSRGFWTIGYGHLLEPQTTDWTGFTWTQDQADAALIANISGALQQAQGLPEWKSLDTDCRRNAVTELVFNMGLAHWIPFHKCRAHLIAQEWDGAASELQNSAWAGQVHAARAGRLEGYIRAGQYPA